MIAAEAAAAERAAWSALVELIADEAAAGKLTAAEANEEVARALLQQTEFLSDVEAVKKVQEKATADVKEQQAAAEAAEAAKEAGCEGSRRE